MTTFASDYATAESALDALSVDIQSAIDTLTDAAYAADKNVKIATLAKALQNVGEARAALGDGSTNAGSDERTLAKLTTWGL